MTRPATILILAFSVVVAAYAQTETKLQSTDPQPNTESWAVPWWMPRHEAKQRERKAMKRVDLVFIGDSITHSWENAGQATWQKYYGERHALNLGFSGDRTEHVLWRLANGAVDDIEPKVAVVMIGTNNAGHRKEPSSETAAGIRTIVDDLQRRLPDTKILLLGIFPRSVDPQDELRKLVEGTNSNIKSCADKERVWYLDISQAFLDDKGSLPASIMPDALHPNAQGYEIWAKAMEPKLSELLGKS